MGALGLIKKWRHTAEIMNGLTRGTSNQFAQADMCEIMTTSYGIEQWHILAEDKPHL